MNARTRIKYEISQLADGLKSRRPLADDLRSLDALLSKMTFYIRESEPDDSGLSESLLELAALLGYGPEDK